MTDSNEELGWWPTAQRALLWGLVMALMWGWFPFVFGGELGLIYVLSPHDIDPDAGLGPDPGSPFLIILAVLIPFFVSCLWTLGGALAGLVLGDIAPSSEPMNPLKSGYFRCVGQWTFWRWFGLNFIAAFCCLFLTIAFEDIVLGIFALFSAAAWVYSLRGALRRARSEGFLDAFSQ